jgi:hypothetical protein
MKLQPELLAQLRLGHLDAYRVAADLLLEQGDPRAQAVVAGLASTARVNPATRRALRQQIPVVDPAFTAPGVDGYRVKRGFVDEVTLKESALSVLPTLLSLEPITSLRVEVQTGSTLASMMATEAFAAISTLTVSAGDAVVRQLTAPVPTLRAFFSRAPLAFDPRLATLFPALTSLYVTTPPDDAWLRAWASFPKLRRLNLPGARLSAEAIAEFAKSSAPLEELNLGVPARGSSTPVLRSTTLASLHTVSVGTAGRAGDLGIRSAAEVGLPALRLIRWFAGKLPGKLRAELRARRIRVT